MVSLSIFALAATLFAASVASKPVFAASDKNIKAAKTNYCKHISLNDEFEQYVDINYRFVKADEDEDSGEIQRFNSTVKFDKDTFVNYAPEKGAVVTKSGFQDAPTQMRFLYSYADQDDKEEAAYARVDIYQQCTVKGSDQWPNLIEVAYFTLPQMHD